MSRETKIKDVKIVISGKENEEIENDYFAVGGAENCIPKNRDAILLYADEPCVEACQKLYDLNIETFTSGGHVTDILKNAFIGIVYDTLSEENKKIVADMINLGIIDKIDNNRGRGLAVNLVVPINSESLVGEVSDKLLALASFFKQQDVLYGRKTLQELQDSYFTPLGNGYYKDKCTFEEIDASEKEKRLPEYIELFSDKWYSLDGELFFVSEDLARKHQEYMDSISNVKTR